MNDAQNHQTNTPAEALRRLYRAYVGLLETGRNRILDLGGQCDPVDRMEDGDPALREAREVLAALTPPAPAGGEEKLYTQAEFDECGKIGERDGYDKAVQDIDQLTGGDGEYVYCMGHDSDRHCPDAEAMKARIVARFEALDTSEPVQELHELPPPSPDVAGVVERLRKVSKECNPDRIQRYYISEGADVTFHDIFVAANTAATLLTTLSAERDNLREKLSRTTEGGAYKIMQLTETIENLSAENARLIEAVTDWIDEDWSGRPGGLERGEYLKIGSPQAQVRKIIDRARALTAPSERPAVKEPNAMQARLLSAISDWKAPYEVADMVGCTGRSELVIEPLRQMVADGLAEHHQGNNTYRAIERPANPITKDSDDA